MSDKATPTTDVAPSSKENEAGKGLELATESAAQRGKTSIADTVVAKIAGIAARDVDGVYDLGGAAERVVGKVREVIPGSNVSTTQGIGVEVGEKQAAVDVSIVAEFGVAIHRLAEAIRRNIVSAIEQMTGLEVTEVNVTVHDIHFDDGETQSQTDQAPRVQ